MKILNLRQKKHICHRIVKALTVMGFHHVNEGVLARRLKQSNPNSPFVYVGLPDLQNKDIASWRFLISKDPFYSFQISGSLTFSANVGDEQEIVDGIFERIYEWGRNRHADQTRAELKPKLEEAKRNLERFIETL